MPLASWASLHFYGPAAAAAVVVAPASATADIAGWGTVAGASSAAASIPLAKATRLRNRPANIAAAAVITSALPKGRARPTATIKVNTLSQDDVTGAVMEAQIEAGLTFRQIVRLLAAVAAGKTDITDLGGGSATVKFRDLADTKDRIVADMTGSERTGVTRDVT
jgi:hypothetical protein